MLDRQDEQVPVAVDADPVESDLAAVRRPGRQQLVGRAAGQLPQVAAVAVDRVEVEGAGLFADRPELCTQIVVEFLTEDTDGGDR